MNYKKVLYLNTTNPIPPFLLNTRNAIIIDLYNLAKYYDIQSLYNIYSTENVPFSILFNDRCILQSKYLKETSFKLFKPLEKELKILPKDIIHLIYSFIGLYDINTWTRDQRQSVIHPQYVQRLYLHISKPLSEVPLLLKIVYDDNPIKDDKVDKVYKINKHCIPLYEQVLDMGIQSGYLQYLDGDSIITYFDGMYLF